MRDLTVSIVVYNNYDDVEQAVASIEKHTNPAISKNVFLIDNSCRSASDNDRQAFENKMSAYADVEYINVGENIGFGKGHNYAMNSYSSRFHAIVNPDITFSEDVFSGLIDFMNNTGAGMCIPRIVDSDGNLQKAYRREITVFDIMNRTFFRNMFKKRDRMHTMQDMDYSKPFEVPFAQGSFLLIKTDLFQKIDGFDDRFFMYLEDADLCKRVSSTDKIIYCPYVTVCHKWEKGSHKSGKLAKVHLQSMFKYFNKWKWKLA